MADDAVSGAEQEKVVNEGTVRSGSGTSDVEVDVVVIGSGAGGAAAAIEASRAGADVLVLERAAHTGGNAAMSTGYVAMCDTEAQRTAGIEDSAELFVADMLREVQRKRSSHGIVFDEALARVYAEESSEVYPFLRELGVGFSRHIPRPQQHSADRMLAIETVSKLEGLLDRAGVPVRLRSSAMRLLTTNGRVDGVLVFDERAGETWTLRARAGVVLAAGGYQSSREMRRRWQPADMSDAPHIGMATCQGDGHLMADVVGGDLINMTMIPVNINVGSRLLEDCIAVNGHGRRFHDEAGPYDTRTAALRAEDGRAHYICDASTFADCEDLIHMMPAEPRRAATLEELARLISVPVRELSASVERWNGFLASDAAVDPEFGRTVLPAGRSPIVEPPFAALPMIAGATFSLGGLRTNPDLQVLNAFGEEIRGLYAVGDCAGGVLACGAMGGIHLGTGFTLGRRAGRRVARG